MADFTADTDLSCKSVSWDVFLKKSIELLSLYTLVDKPSDDSISVILYAKTASDNAFILGHGLQSRKVEMFSCTDFFSNGNKYNEDIWEKLEVDPTWDQVLSRINPVEHDINQIGFIHFCHDTHTIIWSM